MCLSTIYKNEKSKETILMQNVVSIEIDNEFIILTDLMDRQMKFKGTLIKANLVDGFALVRVDEE